MPSPLHEALVTLFRNRPTLAVELLRTGLERTVPPYTEARISAESLTELQPAEYRAGPSAIPVVTARSQAREDPELAVLSAMTHGRAEPETAVQIALSAIDAVEALDAERSTLYLDLVLASLGQAARKALESMDPAKYEYQSDFAKRYFLAGRTQGEALGEARGEARGELRGRAATLLRLLEVRFGALDTTTAERVAHASAEQLEHWAVAALDAHTLEDVFRS